MDSAHLKHVIFTIFLPPILLFFLLLFLPMYTIYKLFLSLITFSNENMMQKVVLITGASSGIGEQLAYEYARRGARLVLTARREKPLREVARNSRKLGTPDVLLVTADVSKIEDCREVVEKTISRFGQLDHLVVNAGVASSCPFEQTQDISGFTQIMDVNFWGSIYPTYYSLPHLRKSKGKIIVNASFTGLVPSVGGSIYGASKAAQISFYETLRAELGSDVTITIATPGFVESEITKGKVMRKEGRMAVDPEFTKGFAVLPTASAEACAKAIVNGACQRKRHLTWPTWYKAVYLFACLMPDVFGWFTRYHVSRNWSPQSNASSREIPDTVGTSQIYPTS